RASRDDQIARGPRARGAARGFGRRGRGARSSVRIRIREGRMSIELDEGTLGRRTGGPDLYFASAIPEGTVKAMLGIVHGYADHGARYRHVMGALAEHGIGSVAIDLRGHGRALGPRGYCDRFED